MTRVDIMTHRDVTQEREAPEGAPFCQQMYERREQLSLPQTRAALRAGISQARWRQIEQGYEARGPMRIPANPTRRTVKKIAAALYWDQREALVAAGFEPDEAPVATNLTVAVLDLWRALPEQKQRSVYEVMRNMTDTDAVAFPEAAAS
jgi:transcriptional regulator with XRE-family HTH domain